MRSFPFRAVETVDLFMLKNEELKFFKILHYKGKDDFLSLKKWFFKAFFFFEKNQFFVFFLKNDSNFLFKIIIRFLFQK